jgi:hypothetical protein
MTKVTFLEYSDQELYHFKIIDEFYAGLQLLTKDHIREQNENKKTWTSAGTLEYKVGRVIGNRARRRLDKREDFSIKA